MSQEDSLNPRTTPLSLRMKIMLASMVCVIVAAITATITGSVTKIPRDSFDSLFVDKQAGPSRINPRAAAASISLLPVLAPTVLHFNGNPPEDAGCTGNGSVDAVGPNSNVCATLTPTAGLSTGPAAKWVAAAGLNGTTDRNAEDPNWLWVLSSPTTLSGPMTVNWWQACNAECVAVGGTWRIRLWADGNLVFLQENVSATPSIPDVPSLLSATVTLPKVTANSKFVLHIDTQFVDTGQGATIFYDSQLPCPGSTAGPCDSTVTMPVVDSNATPTPTPTPTPAPTPGACDSLVFGGADKTCPGVPRYQNFYVPAGSSAEAGAGEFNIGFNPQTGHIMTMNTGPIWRLTPPELLTPHKPECCEALWEDKSAPTTNVGLDPILFTDQKTGRTFASNSTAGAGVVYAYSDNDGDQWVPFAPAPPNGGADHETIGSGPFPAALSMLTTPQNKGQYVLYCSQNLVGSSCQRSLTLGTSWENGVPATGPGTMNSQGCGGLHGHVHIAPNGTAWLPDNSCRGVQGGAVSSDANTTPWTEFVVKGNNDVNGGAPFTSTSQADGADPSIAIDSDNVAYYCYVNSEANGTEGHVHVAVSTDGGKTWIRDVDVGASHGIVNVAHTEAIGGSAGRAACGFIGTNTHDAAGSTYENGNFTGVWYAYIATTYDQGRTWVTVNATPNDPVQYKTGIWQQGGSGENGDRNLLDFNEITVDDKGHVLYGYSDGCVSPGCIAGTSGNDKVAFMRVARQSGGRSIFAGYDVNVNEPAAPKAACLSGMRDSSGAHLTWRVPDNAGSDITGYQILRATTPGGETVLVANTGTSQNTYNDSTALASVAHYFYEVRAINAIGAGPLSIEADLSQPAPVAADDAVTTAENQAAIINVLANDFDGGAGPLTVTSVSAPSHGAAGNNADSTVTYTPATSFFGLDSFTYTLRNARGLTATGKVLITVNAACAVSPTASFSDTLEPAAKPGWTMNTAINNMGPASPTWSLISDPNAQSLTHSFFSDATTLDLKDDRLVTPPQKLSSTSQMIFWHRFNFEDGFDGGALEVSTDGGATWVDVVAGGGSFVSGGYNGTISGSFGSPIAARPAWTGGSSSAAADSMTQVVVNLGAFAGLDRLVRFRLAADRLAVGSLPGQGWWIDDVQFTNTLVETPCGTPTPTPTPTPTSPFTFSPNVQVFDPAGGAQTGAEPSIALDANDNIYATVASARLWRSNNGGANWKFLGAFDSGGDGDLEFDARNRMYACALVIGQGFTSTVSRYSNPASMNSVSERDFKTNTYPLQDRQWLATYGDDTVYLGFHDIGPENVYVTKSTDGGQSFALPIPVITDPVLLANTIPNTNDGRVLVDKNTGAVYIAFAASTPVDNASNPPFGPHRRIIVARSFDSGATWTDTLAFDGPAGTAVANVFPAFAIDSSGNLYAVFSANLDSNLQLTPTGTLNIFFMRSTDRGATFSRPVQVNSDTGSHLMPWAIAGLAGRVDIVWYGTNAVGNPNSFPASGTGAPDWNVYFAQTLDGLSATPTFQQVQVSDHVVHKGQISTGGLTGNADRRLLDFFEVDRDSRGMAHIVWADTGTTATGAANVFYAQQTAGRGILNRPPIAALTATPTSGTAPLVVSLNGSGSSDPDPGDSIASYTFNFGDSTPPVTQTGSTVTHTYSAAATYVASLTVTDSGGMQNTNVASVTIQVSAPPPPPCIEDNDSRIAYSNGWHLINYASASDGHFRYHSGNSRQHFANLDFTVPTGSTGSITYSFAKSPKGGTADIYLDGVFKQTVNYAGSVGSTQAPEFKPEYQVQFGNLSGGAHKLEIKNLTGVVYVDRFCLQNSVSNAQPAAGPGNTTNQSSNVSAGQTSSSNYQMQSGSQEISVVAESSLNVPFKLVLVSPSGLALQTVDASNGIAVINTSVTQSGVYVIKVVNVSLGPLQFTVTATPLVSR